jgi:hypothetical protein
MSIVLRIIKYYIGYGGLRVWGQNPFPLKFGKPFDPWQVQVLVLTPNDVHADASRLKILNDASIGVQWVGGWVERWIWLVNDVKSRDDKLLSSTPIRACPLVALFVGHIGILPWFIRFWHQNHTTGWAWLTFSVFVVEYFGTDGYFGCQICSKKYEFSYHSKK